MEDRMRSGGQEAGPQGLEPFIGDLNPGEAAAFHSLALAVFRKPDRFGFESEDEAAEAFLCYKARLRTIIRKSRTIADNPEAYVDSCLRFLAKSLRRNHRRRELRDQLAAAAEVQEDLAQPIGAEYDPEAGSGDFPDLSPSWFLGRLGSADKRLLFLCLKCAWEIDDCLAERVAMRLGLPPTWLRGLLHRARISVEGPRECLSRLHERKNALWVKQRVLEAQMKDENLRPELRQRLWRREVACLAQYRALRERIARYRLLVSNRVVAEILGVPKGSVDSGLFYLKRQEARGCPGGPGGPPRPDGASEPGRPRRTDRSGLASA